MAIFIVRGSEAASGAYMNDIDEKMSEEPPGPCEPGCDGCTDCDAIYIAWMVRNDVSVEDAYEWDT